MTESVQPSDTAGALLERLAHGGAQLMSRALAGLAGGEAAFVPQSADGVSRAPLINTDDARIQWQLPAAVIERRVRAYTPAPGAWTTFLGQRLRISETSISADDAELAPGQIALVDGHVTVGTGSQGLILQTVTPAGKKPMSARSWWNGLRGDATRRFDSESDR
jgi:methionyl-tRNA formyltransferase